MNKKKGSFIFDSSCRLNFNNRSKRFGFTIVELLVVIVVIGILAAITIVSYSGITNKAITASIKNDLDINLKQLKMYQVDHGYYPSALDANNCPTAPDVDLRYCLKSMSGAVLEYVGGGQSFVLVDTHVSTNISYQIDDGGSMVVHTPVPWKQVVAGAQFTCAVSGYDRLYCWGENSVGQLGDNTQIDKNIPTLVSQGSRPSLAVKSVKVGQFHGCLIAYDNRLYCWGYNNNGQLGDGTLNDSKVPILVQQGDRPSMYVKQVAVGGNDTCAISDNDQIYCWGQNNRGQLGDNTTVNKLVPTLVQQGTRPSMVAKKVSIGGEHTCAISSDDYIYCWGYNESGRLGVAGGDRITPVSIGFSTFKDMNVGGSFACAKASDNRLYCWGANSSGMLGDYSTTLSITPRPVSNTTLAKDFSTGSSHSCAIDDNPGNTIVCWGANGWTQLGYDTSPASYRYYTVQTYQGARPSLNNSKQVSAGYMHTCEIASDDNIYCWGSGTSGELGNGGTTTSMMPVKVTNP